MIILPGDILSFTTDRWTAVAALERCLCPGEDYYPFHVAQVENEATWPDLDTSTLTIREAVPPRVRVNRFEALYGDAFRTGVIRVHVYRYKDLSNVGRHNGLLAIHKSHPIGQDYNEGRLIMGLFPHPLKTVCSELIRTFKLGAGLGNVPKLRKREPYLGTVTPLHITHDPDAWCVGRLVWDNEKEEYCIQ